MGRSCTVCSRPDAGEIARLLSEGRSTRGLAAEFGVSPAAMQRHGRSHMSVASNPQRVADFGNPAAVSATLPGDPLDELVDALRHQALAGNPAIVHQYRLALLAQSTARYAAASARDLADAPEWIELRTRILAALEPFPEARIAVANTLGGE